ncbi:Hypothetical predicted protein [Mytilus galloprovincialis]|uniref:Uncharacterized protein n=1 Tax=Mytilus galloprovincialis TaxID=29158 RepID=A0A8B6F3U3_MYTGA|nr:Hypothetical predicted protein [Mytilus galloprovincialis]
MTKPTDISGVRRFLGMVNQLNKFSCKVTELTKPLRELLKTHNAWHWGIAQETAFTEIKNELASSGTLGHYDPNKDTVVSADASSFGLGAVIRQKHGEILKPVAYASRSLTDAEQRYAQIEKEALVLTWACEKFSNYLIGKKFNLETDHKPLVPLLSSKGIAELPPRIQRFRMRLLRFDFTIEHVPGKELNIADALSRAPVDLSESNEFETETKAYVDSIVKNFPASDMRLQNIRDECVKDEICKTLRLYCKEGWPEKSSLSDSLKPYWSLQGEFTIIGNMLLKADRLVIPRSLQDEILERLHDGHQGIVKCRERAKSSVWWLGMSTMIENMVKRCKKCIENANDHAEPLLQPEFPKRPWQKLASDLFELKGQTRMGFRRHIMSSPRFAQSNGLAERSVQTIKNMLKKSEDQYNSLLSYRTTPLANGYSPAELLMGRKLRTLLPVAPKTLVPKLPNTRELLKKEDECKFKQKQYYDRRHRARPYSKVETNDRVWVKDQKKTGNYQSGI